MPPGLRTRSAVNEMIERGHAVRCGPDADGTGAADVPVFAVDGTFAIQRHRNPAAGECDPQCVPGAACHCPLFTHQGKVPLPVCISTLALPAASGSAATAQCGLPLPVTPQLQPAGGEPTG